MSKKTSTVWVKIFWTNFIYWKGNTGIRLHTQDI